jgi:hypothetical protein
VKPHRARIVAALHALAVLAVPASSAAPAPSTGGGTEVIRPEGEPLFGIEVSLTSAQDSRTLRVVRTDANGRFEFKDTAAGSYRIVVRIEPAAPSPAPTFPLGARRPKPVPDSVGPAQRYSPPPPGDGQGEDAASAAQRGVRIRIRGAAGGTLVRTLAPNAVPQEIPVDVAANATISGTVTRERAGTR